jgi:hypothetical protein
VAGKAGTKGFIAWVSPLFQHAVGNGQNEKTQDLAVGQLFGKLVFLLIKQ